MGLSRGGHNSNFIIEKDPIGFGHEVKLAMKIIVITDQKSGVGKTTSTINIGAGLNQLGKRVTIFDYKPDSHGAEDYLALCREIVGGATQNEKDFIDNNLSVRSGKRGDPGLGEEIQGQSDSKAVNRKGDFSKSK